jgi:hypothetical protein
MRVRKREKHSPWQARLACSHGHLEGNIASACEFAPGHVYWARQRVLAHLTIRPSRPVPRLSVVSARVEPHDLLPHQGLKCQLSGASAKFRQLLGEARCRVVGAGDGGGGGPTRRGVCARYQYAVARSTAWVISSQCSKRRRLRASDQRPQGLPPGFDQGSIRLR